MLQDRTVQDFGEQWQRYRDNAGYYGSLEMLGDILGSGLSVDELRDSRVADIGSGSGRIVNMLLDAGAAHVVAIEPSEAFEVLMENTVERRDSVRYVRDRGEAVGAERDLDYVFSIGVLHHIVDPIPVAHAAYAALRPGGRFVAWLYGHEGNELYLGIVRPLRVVASRLPHPLLAGLSHGLNFVLGGYMRLCRLSPMPLPLGSYVDRVLRKLTREQRRLVIYDQLNPAYAKYYRRAEAEALLADAGFTDIRLEHRHGYSWTVIGTKTAR